MKILTSKLPSGGFGSIPEILDIEPLNYGEFLEYSRGSSVDEVNNLLWDIKHLIQPIESWQGVSSFDLYPLIAFRRMLTIGDGGEVTFESGEKLSLSDIEFTDLDPDVLRISELHLSKTVTPSIKSLASLEETLIKFSAEGVKDLKLAVLGSYTGLTAKELLGLKTQDILICERLYPKIMSQPKFKKKGGGEVILTGRASQLFRLFCTCIRLDYTKVQLQEEV